MPRILKGITLAGWQKQRDVSPLSDPGRSNLTSVPCSTLRGMSQVGGCSEEMSGNSNVTMATAEWLTGDRQDASVPFQEIPSCLMCNPLYETGQTAEVSVRLCVCVCVSSMWENMRLQLHLSQKCLKLFSIGLTSFIHPSINYSQSALQPLLCLRATRP